MNTTIAILANLTFIFTISTQVIAHEVAIVGGMMSVEYTFQDKTYVISRDQDPEGMAPQFYSRTGRACPPFCVQPVKAHKDVETVGELELLEFLVDHVQAGTGYLIDSRTTDFYLKGTIPGAVNLPHHLFIPNEDNTLFDSIMVMLKGKADGFDSWEFENPPHLLLFCNGPWCAQSPSAIRNLLEINYPPERLHYYRGGMQNWTGMGFNIQIP